MITGTHASVRDAARAVANATKSATRGAQPAPAAAVARPCADRDRAAAAVPAGLPGHAIRPTIPAGPTGSVTAPVHNLGGLVGAWIADVLLYLFGYVAFLLPLMLGAVAWIALFGMDSDGRRRPRAGAAPGRHRRLPGREPPACCTCACTAVERFFGRPAAGSSAAGRAQLLPRFGPLGANLFLVACCWCRSPWPPACPGWR
jgi:hypothetical protein